MLSVDSEPDLLAHAELAALATSARPAWLWDAGAGQLLWANAAGAAAFGSVAAGECTKWRFTPDHPAAVELGRLVATLPDGARRFQRFRAFGTRFGPPMTCACSRLILADGTPAVLVAALEPVRSPLLPLAERVRRSFGHDDRMLAAFTADGAVLYANPPAQPLLGGAKSLGELGAAAAAAEAVRSGSAHVTLRGPDGDSDAILRCLGEAGTRVLLLTRSANRSPPLEFSSAASSAPPSARDDAIPERRRPLRFVWQIGADGCFTVTSDEFIGLVGPRTMAALGRPWSEIAAKLDLDPGNQVAGAIETRETWSGVVVTWPLDGTGERLAVELAGLPMFDRERRFCGYRGFGICRDVARINRLARLRQEQPLGEVLQDSGESAARERGRGTHETNAAEVAMPAAAAPPTPTALSANVVPFRSTAPAESGVSVLTAVERRAFRELAQELTARLRGDLQASPGHGDAVAPFASEGDLAPEQGSAGEDKPNAAGAAQNAAETPARFDAALLDRMPVGILVYRHDAPIYANYRFRDLTGYDDLAAFAAEGGVDVLFAGSGAKALAEGMAPQSLAILSRQGDLVPVEAWLSKVQWNDAPALVLILTNRPQPEPNRSAELALEAATAELRRLKRETQKGAAAKADFLAKVSHEIRTPLNAIVGFAEVIMTQRFGPIGNERYGQYAKDIHAAGTHLVALLNDLVDLSKVETGQLELTFADIGLNALIQQCVGIMQPHANRARIIIRTALAPALPPVVADERSVRQILLTLLANSIRLSNPGGQVIVSTALTEANEVLLRVRDTGVGMNDRDIAAALEPFRQAATAGSWGSGGSGFGLPLTKALTEANHANFSLKSAPNAGTLIEIAFPRRQIAAE